MLSSRQRLGRYMQNFYRTIHSLAVRLQRRMLPTETVIGQNAGEAFGVEHPRTSIAAPPSSDDEVRMESKGQSIKVQNLQCAKNKSAGGGGSVATFEHLRS